MILGKKIKQLTKITLAAFSVFFCISCNVEQRTIKSNLNKDKLLVLTTFTVLADISENIAGDRLTVKSITKKGAEIHGYKPTPQDLVFASSADLIVENGLGLELWSRRFTNSNSKVPRVVLSEGIDPLLIEGDIYQGKPNPHAWMSPKKAIFYVDKLLEAFIKLDPDGSDYYLNNAKNYKEKLKQLDKELRKSLSQIPLNRRFLVTCEGAFSYLAKDYGLEEAYLWPVNAESQVTPRRMLRLIKLVKENNIPTIFCESTVSSKAQLEVARASGASFGGTFYVDSLSNPEGPAPTFIELQRHNVRLILEGLMP